MPCEGFAEEGGLIVATGFEARTFDRDGEDEVDVAWLGYKLPFGDGGAHDKVRDLTIASVLEGDDEVVGGIGMLVDEGGGEASDQGRAKKALLGMHEGGGMAGELRGALHADAVLPLPQTHPTDGAGAGEDEVGKESADALSRRPAHRGGRRGVR